MNMAGALNDTDDLEKLAFEFAPIGIVLTEDRVIRQCNRQFANMFGYQRDELIGHSFRMLYASNREFEAIRDVGFKALKEAGRYMDERLMPRRDGSIFWCRVRVFTFDAEAPLARTILTFADISDTRPAISMTNRERQVVKCLAKGMTSKETARELDLSPRTVEDYRARLIKKFEVRNFSGLMARLAGFSI
jgi:PAS domain S-box-containing protein